MDLSGGNRPLALLVIAVVGCTGEISGPMTTSPDAAGPDGRGDAAVDADDRDGGTTATARLMPLGDSITMGVPGDGVGDGGYRELLWRGLADYRVEFVGSLAGGPFDIDPDHEGHPGFRIEQIRAGAPAWLAAAQPDVILLHIGTNNLWQGDGDNLDALVGYLDELVATITSERPTATLLVASVLPMYIDGIAAKVDAYNQRIPSLVASYAAQGHQVRFVDLAGLAGVTPADLPDKVHPNTVGYNKMAAVWLGAVEGLLPRR